MNATGAVIEESRQPMEVLRLLLKYRPEMLILTGHDSILRGKDIMKLENYRSSRYFIEAVRRAREYEPDMEDVYKRQTECCNGGYYLEKAPL